MMLSNDGWQKQDM